MYLVNPVVGVPALTNKLLLPETIVVEVLLLVLNIIFPTPAEVAVTCANEDDVNPLPYKTKEPLWSSKPIWFNLSTSLRVWIPVNVLEPVVAPVLVIPNNLLSTDEL